MSKRGGGLQKEKGQSIMKEEVREGAGIPGINTKFRVVQVESTLRAVKFSTEPESSLSECLECVLTSGEALTQSLRCMMRMSKHSVLLYVSSSVCCYLSSLSFSRGQFALQISPFLPKIPEFKLVTSGISTVPERPAPFTWTH